MFTSDHVPLRREDGHISARSLRVVSAPFGRDYRQFTLQTDIFTPPEDDDAAEALLATLSDGLVFLFHQGTTWETKLWREDGWVSLGRLLLERHPDASILLSWGNEEERQAAERIAHAVGAGTRMLPRLSIKGFAALLKKVDLVAGGDTGPVHMAAAVGTPTVSFYRVTDPKRNAPEGPQHLTVQTTFHCRGCLRKECDRDGPCRESIKPEAMLQAMEKLLFP
jgi:heptosyltransferase-1